MKTKKQDNIASAVSGMATGASDIASGFEKLKTNKYGYYEKGQ